MPSPKQQPAKQHPDEPQENRPQFVILHHQMPPTHGRPSHWDLMLEQLDVLATWALDVEPILAETEKGISCSKLPDHRKAYLDYEGPVSNDRGHVKRWDRGNYLIKSQTDNELVVVLAGELVNGTFKLARTRTTRTRTQSDAIEAWTLKRQNLSNS